MQGQFRVSGMGVVTGWDMGAALAMAGGLGLPDYLICEFLPDIETVVVSTIRERTKASDE